MIFVKTYSDFVNEKTYYHSSIQLEIPHRLSDSILDFLDAVIDPEDKISSRYILPHHISILTGIHQDDIVPVQKIVQEFKPIEATLGTIDMFPASVTMYHPEEHEVLKLDVSGDEIIELHEKLSKILTISSSGKYTFSSHITLLYLKPGTSNKYVGDPKFAGTKLIFKELLFSHQTGQKTHIPL